MRRLASIVVLGALALAGCITPSIPIPPPDPTEMTFQLNTVDPMATTATFSYPPEHNYHGGIVYIYNHDKHVGVIVDVNPVDDSIGPSPPFAAALNDQIVVSVQTVDQTESTCVRLKDGTGQNANTCAF